MEMKAGLKMGQRQSLGQSLSMTIEMRQAIKVLSLAHHELKEAAQSELLKNPLLEEDEGASFSEEAAAEPGPDAAAFPRGASESPAESGGAESLKSPAHQSEAGLSEPSPDFQESFNSYEAGRRSVESLGWEKKEPAPAFENFVQQPVTFKSHLLWQAQVSSVSDQDKFILALLISHLDERGYLRVSFEELSEKENIPLPRLKRCQAFLLTLDPPGSGAGSIEECLLAQAALKKNQPKGLAGVIKSHLKNLERSNYLAIARDLKISLEDAHACRRAIRAMEPAPAGRFSAQPIVYISPDIYISRRGEVSLNREGLPRLRMSSSYARSLPPARLCPAQLKRYIYEKKCEGMGFLRALEQRGETLLKVGRSLAKLQKGFFDRGLSGLRPLVLEDVSRDIGMHLSTVSRATANKYAQTPHGLMRMKSFFGSGIASEEGREIPLRLIKKSIQDWIQEERKKGAAPLSDDDLARRLYAKFSARLSRRAVGKYRDSLSIAPFSLRKKLFRDKQRGEEAARRGLPP